MRRSRFITVTAVAASAMFIGGVSFEALAQTSVDRAFDPSPKDCADVHWSEAALEAFPNIGSACQAVEERNGKSYVKLEGTVEEVDDGGKRVQVDFQDGNTLSFTPTPNTGLYIDGERTPFGELEEGQELNFYIPEDRLQAELQPDPNRLAFVIIPLDIDAAIIGSQQQTVAGAEGNERDTLSASTSSTDAASNALNEPSELPRTAGLLPWIAAGGFGCLLLGLGATIRRVALRE